MKNKIKFFVLIAFVFAAFTVSAQTKTIKLGHINTQELLALMPEFKEAQNKLTQQQQEMEKQMADLQAQYQKLVKEYTEGEKTFTEMARVAKEQEIQSVMERIRNFEAFAQEALRKTQDELFTPILTKARNAIKAVGDENGFTYIFDAAGLLYAAPTSEDILPLVKKKLNIQ